MVIQKAVVALYCEVYLIVCAHECRLLVTPLSVL